MIYREVTRRLNDNCHLRVQPVMRGKEQLADWVHITISNATGTLYTGQMRIWEALVEIPYQLDRAREAEADWERWSSANQEEGETVTDVTCNN